MSTPSRKSSSSSRAAAAASSASKATVKSTKRSKSPEKAPTGNHATEPDRKAPRTPPKQRASSRSTTAIEDARLVTPATSSALALEKKGARKSPAVKSNARRSLSMAGKCDSTAAAATTKPAAEKCDEKKANAGAAKKKLPFGGKTKPIEIPDNVQRVYQIVHKHTGNIGGNGHGGAIYGELTTGSMQKMTNLMIEHTGLSKDSRFIDVGCGLGKPNIHVAQYPGVDFSYGIEMEHVRWMLGIANLYQVLETAKKDGDDIEEESKIGHHCYFAHGDITEANFFDPFTHVYMFDIG